MAQKNHTTNLTELLLQCVAQPDRQPGAQQHDGQFLGIYDIPAWR